jgi:release factor glutamine methyltransferase
VTHAEIARRLATAGVPSPEADARLLLRYADPARLEELVARRVAREPLQLLLGSVGFRYLDLEVRPGVFIPRPETEVLVGQAIARTPDGGLVVEPCTGAGAVAIAIATEASPRAVHAIDRSPAAVELARANAASCGAEITVHEGDLLEPLPGSLRGRVDVLVSNPPYIAAAEMAGFEPEVGWDPPEALVSGPTGFELTDRLTAAALEWLAPGGWLLLETDDARAAETADRARAAGLIETDVVEDLAGRPRVVVARRDPRRGER